MKLLAALLAFAAALSAAPVLQPDSQPLDPGDPGLFTVCRATAGTTCEIWWNDNPLADPMPPADFDFNDAVFRVSFTAGLAFIQYLGGASDWAGVTTMSGAGAQMPLVTSPWVTDGSVARFVLTTPAGPLEAYSGTTWVSVTEVPEPSSGVLTGLACGLIALSLFGGRGKR